MSPRTRFLKLKAAKVSYDHLFAEGDTTWKVPSFQNPLSSRSAFQYRPDVGRTRSSKMVNGPAGTSGDLIVCGTLSSLVPRSRESR